MIYAIFVVVVVIQSRIHNKSLKTKMDAGIEDDDDQEIMAETMVAMDFTKMVEYKRQNAR